MDLFGEQALAADLGEAAVLHPVAGGADHVFLEHLAAAEQGAVQHRAETAEPFEEHAGLVQGQRRAARTHAQRQQPAVRPHAGRGRPVRLRCALGLCIEHERVLRERASEGKPDPCRAVLSQLDEHAPFGGVVPEVAARAHLAHLPGLLRRVLEAVRGLP